MQKRGAAAVATSADWDQRANEQERSALQAETQADLAVKRHECLEEEKRTLVQQLGGLEEQRANLSTALSEAQLKTRAADRELYLIGELYQSASGIRFGATARPDALVGTINLRKMQPFSFSGSKVHDVAWETIRACATAD